jgi:hypothetical protein
MQHNKIEVAKTPDAPRYNETAHSRFLPVEERWPLIDEYSTIRLLGE